jgi:hypothetical protein
LNYNYIQNQNNALKDIFLDRSKIYNNLHYIESQDLIGKDHEGTRDGIHFNDLGFYRAYQILKEEIESIKLNVND